MKLRILLLIGLGLTSSLAMATPGPYGGMSSMQGAEQASRNNPAVVLRHGIDKLLRFMRSDASKNRKEVVAFLNKEIAPYFDFAYMTQWVSGPAYRRMSRSQREALQVRLKSQFLGALAQRLAGYDNQKVQFFRPRRSRRNEVNVSVGILHSGAYPSKIDFRLYRGKDGWKVFDVAANGSSALVHYRQQFNRSFRQQRARMRPVRY